MTIGDAPRWIRPQWTTPVVHDLARLVAPRRRGAASVLAWTGARTLTAARHRIWRALRANLAHVDSGRDLSALVDDALLRHLRYVVEFWALERTPTEQIVDGVRLADPGGVLGPGRDPVLLVGAHAGNWDYAQVALARSFPGLTLIAGEPPVPRLRRAVEGAYEAHGLNVRFLGDPEGRFSRLVSLIDNGNSVMLLSDFTPLRGAATMDFLDGCARLPTGAARLAIATGARIIPFGCWRDELTWNVHVDLQPAIAASDEDADDAAVRTMRRAMSQVSAQIQAHPEDWHLVDDALRWSGGRRGPS